MTQDIYTDLGRTSANSRYTQQGQPVRKTQQKCQKCCQKVISTGKRVILLGFESSLEHQKSPRLWRGEISFCRLLVEVYPDRGNPAGVNYQNLRLGEGLFLVSSRESVSPAEKSPLEHQKNLSLSSLKKGWTFHLAPVIKLNKQSEKSNTGKVSAYYGFC